MRRIDTATRAIDLHGPGRDGFRDGEGAATLASTRLRAEWWNQVQEEIARSIELSGQAIDPASHTQLHAAIQRSRVPLIVTGQVHRTSSTAADGTLYVMRDICYAPGCGIWGENMFFAAGSLGIQGALWTSHDGYNSWSKFLTGSALFGIAHGGAGALGSRRAIAVGQFDSGIPVLYVINDGGGAPEPQSLPGAISGINAGLRSVCWHDRGSGTQLWVACGRRSGPITALIAGTEDGTSWTMSPSGPAGGFTGHFTKCISTARGTASGAVIVIGEAGEIQRSGDGLSFTRVLSDPGVGTLTSITQIDDGTLLVATSQGRTLKRSVDDGLTWDEVYVPSLPLEVHGVIDARIELVTSFGHVAVAYCKDYIHHRRIGVISYDGGLTWPDAFRLPTATEDTSQAPWYQPVAATNDGQRLVMVANVLRGAGPTTDSMIFASAQSNTIAL